MSFDANITFFKTNDLEVTSEFYTGKLELSQVLEQSGCRIFKVAGKAYIGFCSCTEEINTKGVIITLVTKDVDEWSDKLRREGIQFEKEPAFNPKYNIYHCFLRDPNGYLIEIQRFEDPRWETHDNSV